MGARIGDEELSSTLVDDMADRVRFFSRVSVISPSPDKEELPRLGTKRISINLSLTKGPKSPTSPTGEKADPMLSPRSPRDDDEDDSFVPNPPRILQLKMPTLTRRKRGTSRDRAGPSILAHNRDGRPKKSRRLPDVEPCPMVDVVPELPSGSPSTFYRNVQASGSPTSQPEEEHLHDCCAKCQASYSYGLLPDERYREHFSQSAKRKRERDRVANLSPVPGESPALKPINDDDVPVLETSATLVDELSKLRPEHESVSAVTRRASLPESSPDLVSLSVATPPAMAIADDDDDDDEAELTAPLRRRPASTGVILAPTASSDGADDRTGAMRRRGTSLKNAVPYGSFSTTTTKLRMPLPAAAQQISKPAAATAPTQPTVSPVEEKDEDGAMDEDDDQETAPLARSRGSKAGRYSLPAARVVPLASLMKPIGAPSVADIKEEGAEALPPMRRASTTPARRPEVVPTKQTETSAPLRHTTFSNKSSASQASDSSAESKRPRFKKRFSSFLASFSSSPAAPVSSSPALPTY